MLTLLPMRRPLLIFVAGLWAVARVASAQVPAAATAALPLLPTDDPARLEARYRLTYRPDSMLPATRTEPLRLLLGERLSRFDNLDAVYVDSVMNARLNLAEATGGSGGSGGEKVINLNIDDIPADKMRHQIEGIIYKTTAPRAVITHESIGMTKYVYREASDFLTWSITPATSTVAGYACQRATAAFAGRRWEAWFTREVPRSDGPYKFNGLPGLIVKVGDTGGNYVFELTALRTLPAPKPIPLPEAKGQVVTRTVFRQGQARFAREGLAQMLASGNIRFGSPEEEAAARQRAQQRAKKLFKLILLGNQF